MTLWPESPRLQNPGLENSGLEYPGLDQLLADPLVRATMRADGVEPAALTSLMATVARRIAARRAGFLLAKPMGLAKPAGLPPDAIAGSLEGRAPPFAGPLGQRRAPGGPCDCAPCW